MTDTIRVTLPDGSSREYPAGTTVLDVAESIGPRSMLETASASFRGGETKIIFVVRDMGCYNYPNRQLDKRRYKLVISPLKLCPIE